MPFSQYNRWMDRNSTDLFLPLTKRTEMFGTIAEWTTDPLFIFKPNCAISATEFKLLTAYLKNAIAWMRTEPTMVKFFELVLTENTTLADVCRADYQQRESSIIKVALAKLAGLIEENFQCLRCLQGFDTIDRVKQHVIIIHNNNNNIRYSRCVENIARLSIWTRCKPISAVLSSTPDKSKWSKTRQITTGHTQKATAAASHWLTTNNDRPSSSCLVRLGFPSFPFLLFEFNLWRLEF